MAKTGRPKALSDSEPRQFVGFYSPGALKAQLMAAAQANGRSLSQEAVSRIEQSFRTRETIAGAFGGEPGLKVAMMLFANFRFSGEQQAAALGIEGDRASWA